MLGFSPVSNRANNRSFLERRGLSILFLCLSTIFLAATGYIILERGQPLGWTRTRHAIEPVLLPPQKAAMKSVVDVFKRNQNISGALLQHDISNQDVHLLVEKTRPVYNLARISAGRPYWLYYNPDGNFHDFRYPVDDDRYLTVYREGTTFVPVMKKFPYETRLTSVSGAIEGSLFLALKEFGEREQLALDFADVFMWDVDFYTDIQRGDRFRILVEKNYLDGRFVKYGSIVAASLTNQGKTHFGFRFQDESGAPGYYAPDGKSLKKSFLKSPLRFARITSRFSLSRKHPILKVVRPHLGVDYAAPEGTPVVAVGAGTVAVAARNTGSGKMVKLRHVQGYETMYLHLSRIAVKPGAHVAQGEVIGYTGATGLATGPHLDFRVVQHGRFVNPTKVVFPPAPPLSQGSMARFAVARNVFQQQLERAAF